MLCEINILSKSQYSPCPRFMWLHVSYFSYWLDICCTVPLQQFLRASAMLKHVIAIGLTSVCLSVRPSVRPSVTRWYCMKTAQHIVMIFSPHNSPFILVLCVTRSSRNSYGVTPCGGAKQRWGVIKQAIFQKNGASINRSIQRTAINLVRRSTVINTLATAVRVSTVNSHFQSNEH